LERRERLRGHRVSGRPADQFDRVHVHARYDVECDTEWSSPRECAQKILAFVAAPVKARAFNRMTALHRSS